MITTIYEPHKNKWVTTIGTKDKHGEEWVVYERHDEEVPSKELMQQLHTILSEAVDKANQDSVV